MKIKITHKTQGIVSTPKGKRPSASRGLAIPAIQGTQIIIQSKYLYRIESKFTNQNTSLLPTVPRPRKYVIKANKER